MLLIIIAATIIVVSILKECYEKELPSGYHNNIKLEKQDADKVRFGEMTQAEFVRNMNNGKYR